MWIDCRLEWDVYNRLASRYLTDVAENKLEGLPEKFGALTNLKVLSLHSNPVDSLPESFQYLENLERLKIFRVQIVSLPDATLIGLTSMIQFELDKRLMMSLSTAQVSWCRALKDLLVREK